MTAAELKEFDSLPSPHIKYWTPIQWVYLLLRKAREMKMIESDYIMMDLVEVSYFSDRPDPDRFMLGGRPLWIL